MMRAFILSFSLASLVAIPAFAANAGGGAPIGIVLGPDTGPVDVANGTVLATTVTPSDVHLENGVDVRIAARSASTVYDDQLVLQDGAIKIGHFDGYSVHADGLTIEADSFDTQAVIRKTPKTIEIASIGGAVRVTDSGTMMTRVLAGTKMAFQNTSGSNTGANGNAQTPAQTGAAPAPTKTGPMSDKKIILWTAGICAVGAIVVGAIAASQGKSPF